MNHYQIFNKQLNHSICSTPQPRKIETMNVILAYVDPSVMTYTIQAVAGVVIALGAVIGVTWRIMKKKAQKVLKIDENQKKEVEDDVQIIEDNPAQNEQTDSGK